TSSSAVPGPELPATPPEEPTLSAQAPPENFASENNSSAEPSMDSSIPAFYNSLAPYGTWVDVAGFGPCWQPTAALVDGDWQPYRDPGHWVYSDYGGYSLSDYSWVWAPVHYC